ncbi:MAG: hypothetical protein M3094_08325 [Actinomycetia bacterium]|nr:hypothetical protein [Actinomycetes bacterium]
MKNVYNQRDNTYYDPPGGWFGTLMAFIAINLAMSIAAWFIMWMMG